MAVTGKITTASFYGKWSQGLMEKGAGDGVTFKQKITLKKGPGAAAVSTQLKELKRQIIPILNQVAKSTSAYIKLYIDNRRRRMIDSTSGKRRLASAFKDGTVVFTGNYMYIGLGNRAELDKTFPYWEVLNYGGYTPGKTVGWFGRGAMPDADMAGASAPGGRMDAFHWEPNSDDRYLMNPQRPIEGNHYIEATNLYIKGIWDKAWMAFKNDVEHRVGYPTGGNKGIPLSKQEANLG